MTCEFKDQIVVLSGSAHPQLAHEISERLGIESGAMKITRFPDGELHVRIDSSVRGKDVFLVQPTCPPVNENFVELLIILDALYRASAGRITVIIPYYGYARQDKKTAGREPITARMIADMITTGGANRILTVDLHSPQIQGFFNIPVDHLTAVRVLSEKIKGWNLSNSVIVAPDAGRINMATDYANRLNLPVVIIHKRRTGPEETEVAHVVGDVKGCRPIIIDDMITTGGTIHRSVEALLREGAKDDIRVVASHGVLVGKAMEYLSDPAINKVIISNTVPVIDNTLQDKLVTVSVAPLIARAIELISSECSVSELFS
ncbi:MAG: ribose-phosphate diphosphokinase [Armatimonadota bacterium]